MSRESINPVIDSDQIGAQMGNAIESMIFPEWMLELRDSYLISIYKNQLEGLEKTTAKNYFSNFADANRVKNIQFDHDKSETVVPNPDPKANTADLKWSRQVEWANKVLSRGFIAALDKGDDYLEAMETLMSQRFMDKARSGLRKVEERRKILGFKNEIIRNSISK